tara:strand:- start:22 stop:579 length:558 start_codon:yes stop_codon:yes gene_type:complete
MLSVSSLTNSKLQILKTSILLITSHYIRCNYGEFTCGNINFLKNLLSILLGIFLFNFIGIRMVKKIPMGNKKIYNILKNMMLYLSIIFVHYFIIDSSLDNKISLIKIGVIMSIYNIIATFFDDQKDSSLYKNLNYKRLFLNSVNLNLFIILVDLYIFDKQFSLNIIKLISYFLGIIFYLFVKKLI